MPVISRRHGPPAAGTTAAAPNTATGALASLAMQIFPLAGAQNKLPSANRYAADDSLTTLSQRCRKASDFSNDITSNGLSLLADMPNKSKDDSLLGSDR